MTRSKGLRLVITIAWIAVVLIVIATGLSSTSALAEGTGGDPPILNPVTPDSVVIHDNDTLGGTEPVEDSVEWPSLMSWLSELWN